MSTLRRKLWPKLYEMVRAEDDPEDPISLSRDVRRSTTARGLPGFGLAAIIARYVRKLGFDGMLVDEGSQGISLRLFDPRRHARIVGQETMNNTTASTKGKMLDKPCKDCEGSVWNVACKINGCVGLPFAVANLAGLFSGTNKTCNKSHRSYKPSLMEASANNTVANLQRELSVLFNLATIEGSNARYRSARRAARPKG